MKQDDFAARAERAGLRSLAQRFPAEAKKALEGAAAIAAALPKDLGPADEPAHVFSLAPKAGERR